MTKPKKHKQRIGLVLSAVPGYSETFFRNKISGLQRDGFEVVLFVDYKKPNDSDFGCPVVAAHNFGSGLLKTLRYIFVAILKSVFSHPKRSFKLYTLNKVDGISLKENIKQLILNQFLLTQTLDWLHFGFGMLAVNRENVAEAISAKMAVSFRGYDLYLSPLKHPNCYQLLFKMAVQYHVLSQEMKHDLIREGISDSVIFVITPAIDVGFFKSESKKTKLDLNSKIQLVTVGRLHWKKGFEYTLEALAYLKQEGIAFHYTIIGDGDEKERLMFAAHQLGILDHITFAGKLSQDAVKDALTPESIYIQYSIQEGFCNAVLEAQAMGLLCVVSDAEGLQENVLHAETGWVVPKRQPQLLALQIQAIHLLSETEKQEIRDAAIKRVQRDFNLRKQQHAFLKFYNQ